MARWRKRQNLVGREGAAHIFDLRLNWGAMENDQAGESRIRREAVSPLVFANLQRFKMPSFHIDIPLRSGGESTDDILVEWSDDGKKTWKGGSSFDGTPNVQPLDTGPRLRRNRMGQTRTGRHIRITTDAKRRVDILGAYVETDVAPD